MEVLLDESIDLERVADLCCDSDSERRPPAPRDDSVWHVSNLLKSAALIAKGDVRYWESDGEPSGIMSMGRIWESAVDCYLAHYVGLHRGAYIPNVMLSGDYLSKMDNIVGSLDGLIRLPDFGWMVSETKLRFSTRSDIPLDHLQQIRAYCHLAHVNTACYVSGHLSSAPPSAVAKMRVLRFTEQSIAECWQMIVNTREYLAKLGLGPRREE